MRAGGWSRCGPLSRRWHAVGLALWVHVICRQVGVVVEFGIFCAGRSAAKLESAVRATRFGVGSVWQCYGHVAVVRSGAVVVPPDPQCSGRSIAHDESPGAQPLRSGLGRHEATAGVLTEGDIDQLRCGARAVITLGLLYGVPTNDSAKCSAQVSGWFSGAGAESQLPGSATAIGASAGSGTATAASAGARRLQRRVDEDGLLRSRSNRRVQRRDRCWRRRASGGGAATSFSSGLSSGPSAGACAPEGTLRGVAVVASWAVGAYWPRPLAIHVPGVNRRR